MAVPCTMILLDPDLDLESPQGRRPVHGDPDADPAPRANSAKRSSVSASVVKPLNLKMPTARSLVRFLSLAQAAVRLHGQVTVLLTTDAAIKDLNRRFRRKNTATDVLSFPAATTGAEIIAGDLAISVETARRQATACGHSLGIELKILMLHGLLHLAGYDHESDAGRMARRERLLRERLNLPQGLIERAETIPQIKQIGNQSSPTLAAERRRKNGVPKVVADSKTRIDRKVRK